MVVLWQKRGITDQKRSWKVFPARRGRFPKAGKSLPRAGDVFPKLESLPREPGKVSRAVLMSFILILLLIPIQNGQRRHAEQTAKPGPHRLHRMHHQRECRRIVLLRRLYARLRPDVIVVIGTTRAFVNVPATRGYRVVAKEYFSIDHRSQLTSSLSRRLTARHAQAIVALSEYDARVYRQRYGAKKAVVIPNPLTFAAPQPSPLQDKVVLGLGRMSYVKGFDLLLDAWSRVAHKDWELHLVGDGKMKKKLERMVRDRGIGGVRFFPATSDVEPHYRSASIFVLPSRSEAFGNVLLEAMSVGLPVVSFDCGAGPRDIILPGQTGVFVPPGDTASMAGELDRLMADPGRLRRMGNAARESIRRYDRGLIVSQWEDLLIKTSRE